MIKKFSLSLPKETHTSVKNITDTESPLNMNDWMVEAIQEKIKREGK